MYEVAIHDLFQTLENEIELQKQGTVQLTKPSADAGPLLNGRADAHRAGRELSLEEITFKKLIRHFGFHEKDVCLGEGDYSWRIPLGTKSSLSEEHLAALRIAKDRTGKPLLHCITRFPFLKLGRSVVRFLLEIVHVPINQCDSEGNTALQFAYAHHGLDMMEALIKYYPGMPELINLTHRNHAGAHIIDMVLAQDLRSIAIDIVCEGHASIIRDLHLASIEKYDDVSQLMLQLTSTCRLDLSAYSLHDIVAVGHLYLLQRKLLEISINVNECAESVMAPFGLSPLMMVFYSNTPRIKKDELSRSQFVAALLEHDNIKVNMTTSTGMTAMGLAISNMLDANRVTLTKEIANSHLQALKVLIADGRVHLSIDSSYSNTRAHLLVLLRMASFSNTLDTWRVYFIFECLQMIQKRWACAKSEWNEGIMPIARNFLNLLHRYEADPESKILKEYLMSIASEKKEDLGETSARGEQDRSRPRKRAAQDFDAVDYITNQFKAARAHSPTRDVVMGDVVKAKKRLEPF